MPSKFILSLSDGFSGELDKNTILTSVEVWTCFWVISRLVNVLGLTPETSRKQ